MPILASAPGKVVLLGEYAVLDGASALVMACKTRCTASLEPIAGPLSELTTRMPGSATRRFAPGTGSGSALVDTVLERLGPGPGACAWRATIDSSAFFVDGLKLGLGSSAAALVAFAGAWARASGSTDLPDLSLLIQCHRDFQGGSGSGIDVAAARTGGVLQFRLDEQARALIGSVRLPKSVGFAGIFAGGSASTPSLVGRYRQWADSGSARTATLQRRMFAVAAEGSAALGDGDEAAFVAAIDEYGRCLAALGEEIGADLVTRSHRQIGKLAGEFGLAYKVSGAGGGDVGIACGLDPDALLAFSASASEHGFHAVPMTIDDEGLRVKEQAE
jgi:phosphomevalonate kinase